MSRKVQKNLYIYKETVNEKNTAYAVLRQIEENQKQLREVLEKL